jgi:putative membrane protein
MPDPFDPRVYFAAERTLLAWVRSGLGVIGLGFVVARFGLFLALASPSHDTPAHHGISNGIGVALVMFGAIAALAAAVQHRRFCGTLAPQELPRRYWTGLGQLFGLAVAGGGFALAAYLLVWAGT